jgi:hypothetical protein
MTSFFSTPQNLSSTPLNIRETSLSPIPKISSVLARTPTAGAKDRDGGGGGKMLATSAISGMGKKTPAIRMLRPPCCSFWCPLATAPGAPLVLYEKEWDKKRSDGGRLAGGANVVVKADASLGARERKRKKRWEGKNKKK